MKQDIFEAALAGLLHDIGKFAQRAGELFGISWNENRDIQQAYGYQHALYTDQVIERLVPERWRPAIRALAGHHHRPRHHRERIITLADRLSAGERTEERQDHPQRLRSIFCSLTGLVDEQGRPLAPPEESYLPLEKLAIERQIIFPGAAEADSSRGYKTLWDRFETEAIALRDAHSGDQADPVVYLESMRQLMRQYTWCIPSAYYRAVPDVSLYDHSRMTAALAVCLAEQDEARVQAWLQGENREEPVALLVGGDISGVQNFIYTITSRGATGGLRGRSFYLQLLTELLARYLLDELGLPLTNLIYAGGGHFYFLAPLSSREILSDRQRRISRSLLHHHQGDLYLALATDAIAAAEFSGDRFRARWDSLQKRLQWVKQRKFAELQDELACRLFAPLEHGGSLDKQCVVCQREHPKTDVYEPDNPERSRKCPACLGFEQLGKDLRRANYLCLDQIDPTPADQAPPGDWQTMLNHFGYRVTLSEQPPPAQNGVKRRHLLLLNDTVSPEVEAGVGQTLSRHFLVNVTPLLSGPEIARYRDEVEDLARLKVGDVKPFEVMVKQGRGIGRLGVLRMDLDNLGQILSRGLAGEQFTLSRMATLSFSLSLFFEGWVGRIAAEIGQAHPGERLYSIYSGGDDLFFVGAWDLMPILAERINQELGEYTAGHPAFHLSGGIALIPAKYPLYQAAGDVAEAEAQAKAPRPDLSRPGETMTAKNALVFLGEVIPWDKFGYVKEKQEQLAELVESKKAPRQLLQRLQQLYLEFAAERKKQVQRGRTLKLYWGPGQWHSAYSLSRLAQQNKQVEDEILGLRDELYLDRFSNIQWLGLAARWADLLTRKGDDQDQ